MLHRQTDWFFLIWLGEMVTKGWVTNDNNDIC